MAAGAGTVSSGAGPGRPTVGASERRPVVSPSETKRLPDVGAEQVELLADAVGQWWRPFALEPQRIGDGAGDQRFRQSISLAVRRNTTASES
jgi:hypothetical protein